MKKGTRIFAIASTALMLNACSIWDDETGAGTTGSLSGTAATGAPIANGAITVKCAGGSDLQTTTASDGQWSVTLSGHTLPCAVQVSAGGGQNLHSLAYEIGTVNVTPLTDLVVANLVGVDPANWFAGLGPSAWQAITSTAVGTAVGNIKTALNLPALQSLDPIRDSFQARAGNTMDDILEALADALASSGMDYGQLLAAAYSANFANAVQTLATALNTAYANHTSGSGAGSSGGSSSGGGSSAGGTGGSGSGGSNTAPVLSSGSGYHIAYSGYQVGIDGRNDVTATFDAVNGGLTAYTWNTNPQESPSIGTMKNADLWGNGVVTIGRWHDGTWAGTFFTMPALTLRLYGGFHYAVGTASSAIPGSGQAAYAITAQTQMTWSNYTTNLGGLGEVSGNVAVDFGAKKVALDLQFPLGGIVCTIQTTGGTASPSSSQISIGATDATVSGNDRIGRCDNGRSQHYVYARGFFADADGKYLALALRFDDTTGSAWGSVVMVLTKEGSTGGSSAGSGGSGGGSSSGSSGGGSAGGTVTLGGGASSTAPFFGGAVPTTFTPTTLPASSTMPLKWEVNEMFSLSVAANLVHLYYNNGQWSVMLTSSDQKGVTIDTANRRVTFTNTPLAPAAFASGTVTLNGTLSW